MIPRRATFIRFRRRRSLFELPLEVHTGKAPATMTEQLTTEPNVAQERKSHDCILMPFRSASSGSCVHGVLGAPHGYVCGCASLSFESTFFMRTVNEITATVTPKMHTIVAPMGQSLIYDSTAPRMEARNAMPQAQ